MCRRARGKYSRRQPDFRSWARRQGCITRQLDREPTRGRTTTRCGCNARMQRTRAPKVGCVRRTTGINSNVRTDSQPKTLSGEGERGRAKHLRRRSPASEKLFPAFKQDVAITCAGFASLSASSMESEMSLIPSSCHRREYLS
eukprot:scaffold122937_cov30-Tisochrysis_lutea.AAC.2